MILLGVVCNRFIGNLRNGKTGHPRLLIEEALDESSLLVYHRKKPVFFATQNLIAGVVRELGRAFANQIAVVAFLREWIEQPARADSQHVPGRARTNGVDPIALVVVPKVGELDIPGEQLGHSLVLPDSAVSGLQLTVAQSSRAARLQVLAHFVDRGLGDLVRKLVQRRGLECSAFLLG